MDLDRDSRFYPARGRLQRLSIRPAPGGLVAHYRQGHAEEPRRWLDKAEQWIKIAAEALPRGDNGMFLGRHVHD